MVLVIVMEGLALLGHPHESLMCIHEAFIWMLRALKKLGVVVFRQDFWMMKCGHPTPKRSTVWGNTRFVRAFDLGQLSKAERDGKRVKTAHTWIKDTGEKAWQGSADLKGTQTL